jgi:phospholipid/cholesterol/gamma-HCH transport system ATP-binding protein
MINLKDVRISFGGQIILDDINFEVERGKTEVILGPSGAGKSSLLKVILGLWRVDKGRVIIDNQDITNLSEKELFPVRRRMAMVFQGNALFDSLTVEQNVSYFLRENKQFTEKEIKSKVKECLSFVNLEDTESLYPEELSGGMKKRVAIARAIALNPEIILYDEPTTGLDPINSKIIIELINKLQSSGATSLVVTHIIRDALSVCDSMTVIDDGRIVANGSANDLLTSDNKFIKDFFYEVHDEAALLNKIKNK